MCFNNDRFKNRGPRNRTVDPAGFPQTRHVQSDSLCNVYYWKYYLWVAHWIGRRAKLGLGCKVNLTQRLKLMKNGLSGFSAPKGVHLAPSHTQMPQNWITFFLPVISLLPHPYPSQRLTRFQPLADWPPPFLDGVTYSIIDNHNRFKSDFSLKFDLFLLASSRLGYLPFEFIHSLFMGASRGVYKNKGNRWGWSIFSFGLLVWTFLSLWKLCKY